MNMVAIREKRVIIPYWVFRRGWMQHNYTSHDKVVNASCPSCKSNNVGVKREAQLQLVSWGLFWRRGAPTTPALLECLECNIFYYVHLDKKEVLKEGAIDADADK